MPFTSEQKLFLDMTSEAKTLLKCTNLDFNVVFDDYPCIFIQSKIKSMSYYPPMIPNYRGNELLVLRDWTRDIVDDFLPTPMRSLAYYYSKE